MSASAGAGVIFWQEKRCLSKASYFFQKKITPAPVLRPQNQKARRKRAPAAAAPAPKSTAAPDPSALEHSQTPGTAYASPDPPPRSSTHTDRCRQYPPYAAPAPRQCRGCPPTPPASDTPGHRSEERRVGKEWRS